MYPKMVGGLKKCDYYRLELVPNENGNDDFSLVFIRFSFFLFFFISVVARLCSILIKLFKKVVDHMFVGLS